MKDFCEGKTAYEKKSAETLVNHVWHKRSLRLRAYRCPTCNWWHVGKPGKRGTHNPRK